LNCFLKKLNNSITSDFLFKEVDRVPVHPEPEKITLQYVGGEILEFNPSYLTGFKTRPMKRIVPVSISRIRKMKG
jgi:hypothetical protein